MDKMMEKILDKGAHNLIARDLKHVWHPCSQMKDYEVFKPIPIRRADRAFLELQDGRRVIDANSSWWCKVLGHGHPRLRQALIRQAERFEHVLLANTTNEAIVTLSEKLAGLTTTLDRVTYASDGACAVEMALKMSVHAQQLRGEAERSKIMALAGAYHGETCTALGLNDLALYKKPYLSLIPQFEFIHHIPYVKGKTDPLWEDCGSVWPKIEAQLEPHASSLASIIVEPIVQGAAGMLIYSQDFLKRLRRWTKDHGVYLIVDEVFTGMGWTGWPLALQHAKIEPDFLCLGKGLTGGWLPMSAMLTSTAIYNLFYEDYELGRNFMHSHTYAGNPLAAAVALECLTILEDSNIYARVREHETSIVALMQEVADQTNCLQNVRGIGAVVAADLIVNTPDRRLGFEINKRAAELGALLRSIGNTIYWLLPLNCEHEVYVEVQRITSQAISEVMVGVAN